VTVEKGNRVASVKVAFIEQALQLLRELGQEHFAQEKGKKGAT
jgi:hypothetical protein